MEERYSKQIEQLFFQMYEMLFEYAVSILQQDSRAEAAVQEVFCIACQKSESLCESPNPSGWLVNALRYVIKNMNRKVIHEQQAIGLYMAAEEEAFTHQQPLKLDMLYEDLATREDYLLLKEMAVEGASCQEMADRRGITAQTCRKRIQRAKESLKKDFFEMMSHLVVKDTYISEGRKGNA